MDFNTKDNLQTMCVNYCTEHLNFLPRMGAKKTIIGNDLEISITILKNFF